ncbi:MAG: hypothetical protein ACP5M1_11590 [Acidiphilium sp.]
MSAILALLARRYSARGGWLGAEMIEITQAMIGLAERVASIEEDYAAAFRGYYGITVLRSVSVGRQNGE